MYLPRILAAASGLIAAAALSGDWPGFRGDGTSHAPPGEYPVRWSPADNVAWTADLPGYGQSAPAVVGGMVYVAAVEGPNKETNHVLALDAATGDRRWTHSFASSAPAKNTPMIGRAAPTPAADEAGVYAFFESGDLVALSPAGEVRWKRSLTAEYGPFTNRHGLGSSPAQTADTLYMLVDQDADGYLLALDKATGEIVWKVDRPARSGWSSPTVATVGGVEQVIVSAGGSVDGYACSDGRKLWTVEGLTGNSVPSPAVTGDLVVVGARPGRRGGDAAAVSQSNRAIRVTRHGDGFAAETAWEAEKVVSHYASPLVAGDAAYYVNNVGVLFRLDSTSGALKDRVRAGRPCWATPVAAGGRVYLFGDDGTTTVFETGEELREVASNHLWDPAGAPAADPYAAGFEPEARGPSDKPSSDSAAGERPASSGDENGRSEYDRPTVYGVAAAGGAFFVRTGTRLYCVRRI